NQGSEIVHVATNSATPGMRNKNHNLLRKLCKSQQIHAPCACPGRIVLQKRMLLFRVRRIQLGKRLLRALGKVLRRARAERYVAQMPDEHVTGDQVMKTC